MKKIRSDDFVLIPDGNDGEQVGVVVTADNETEARRFFRNLEDLRGPVGREGDKGERGEPGRRGRRGERGLTPEHEVAADPKGYVLRFLTPNGNWGESITIRQGEVGPPGRPGDPGAKGDKGDPGAKGAKGDTGDKGDAGRQGEQGEQGPPGSPGRGGGRSANPTWDVIELTGTDLVFRRSTAGPLGPTTTVDLSSIAGGGGNFLEFVPQTANPGSVAAFTLWMDDGTNFAANTVAMGDLTVPMLLTSNVGFGPPGTEQGGINVNGTIYDAVAKINSFGGSLDASLILHRHSTSFPANLTFARANSDTTAHGVVALGQTLGSHIFTGWTGSHYDIGAVMDARVGPVGTVGVGSLPTELAFFTTPDSADAAALAMIIGSDQIIYGSNVSQGELQLRGTQNANLGFIRMSSPVLFDSYSANPTAAYGFSYTATEVFTAGFVGGGMNFSGNITFQNSTFIYESFRGAPTITSDATPGFAAYTVMQALPTMIAGNGAAEHPIAPLILNAGPTIRNPFSGTRNVTSIAAVNFAPQMQGTVAGATMTAGNITAFVLRPTWSTVAGSIINFGNIRGLHAQNPTVSPFGTGAGTERLNTYIAVDVDNITLNSQFGSAFRAALRSQITAGNNKWFIVNSGGAPSDFGTGTIRFDDAGAIILGTSDDVRLEWDGPNNAWNWNPLVGEDLGIVFGFDGSKPTYLFEAATFGQSETDYTQIRFGFDRYAFGQAGSIGNQVGVFVAGNRTVEVAGGWSDYLLTQAGNLNIGTFAMSDVAAWTINQIALDNTAGSIGTLDTLVVGGMTTSNPGITVTERSALRVQGRHKQSGSVQYPPIAPAALGAGDNDDWAGLLTGSPNNNGRYWARVSGNVTTSVITGIDATAVQDGDTFEITNVSANTILLADQNAGSVAANRIITGVVGSYSLAQDETATVRYDATTSRWRITTPAGAVLPLASTWKFDSTVTMADPGSTFFRLNNATLASVTAIAISDITFKEGDASAILAALGAGDQMYLQNSRDAAQRMVFDITSVTDNTTWFQINGTVNTSGSAFSNNAEFTVVAIFA